MALLKRHATLGPRAGVKVDVDLEVDTERASEAARNFGERAGLAVVTFICRVILRRRAAI